VRHVDRDALLRHELPQFLDQRDRTVAAHRCSRWPPSDRPCPPSGSGAAGSRGSREAAHELRALGVLTTNCRTPPSARPAPSRSRRRRDSAGTGSRRRGSAS
jgi:hypothetical protein